MFISEAWAAGCSYIRKIKKSCEIEFGNNYIVEGRTTGFHHYKKRITLPAKV
jgi:hypothetical protein